MTLASLPDVWLRASPHTTLHNADVALIDLHSGEDSIAKPSRELTASIRIDRDAGAGALVDCTFQHLQAEGVRVVSIHVRISRLADVNRRELQMAMVAGLPETEAEALRSRHQRAIQTLMKMTGHLPERATILDVHSMCSGNPSEHPVYDASDTGSMQHHHETWQAAEHRGDRPNCIMYADVNGGAFGNQTFAEALRSSMQQDGYSAEHDNPYTADRSIHTCTDFFRGRTGCVVDVRKKDLLQEAPDGTIDLVRAEHDLTKVQRMGKLFFETIMRTRNT